MSTITAPAATNVSQYAGKVLGCSLADWPNYRILAVADTVEEVHEKLTEYCRPYFVYAVPNLPPQA